MIPRAHILQNGLKSFQKNPDIITGRNYLYIPCTKGPENVHFGIYDEYGRLVPSAGPRIGWPNHSVGQEQSCCVSPSSAFPLAPEKRYIYGGFVSTHFGHFLVGMFPRYWPRYWYGKRFYEKTKIVIHSEYELDYIFSINWLREIFAEIGLQKDDFVIFDRPTRITELVIPGTSFEENHFVHKVFHRFCTHMRRKEYTAYPEGEQPIFLTRSAYKSPLRAIKGEEHVADHLEKKYNYTIISPETLSFSQQMRLFSPNRPTIGFIGSAFHNSIFCNSPIGLALSCEWQYNSNYYLMDQVNQARIAYIQAPYITQLPLEPDQPDHYQNFQVDDPIALAECIHQLVKYRIWEEPTLPTIPDKFDTNRAYHLRTHHGGYMHALRQTGIIYHGDAPESDQLTRIIAYFSSTGWIMLTTANKDCLSIPDNLDQGSALYYRVTKPTPQTIALQSYRTERFLTALSDGRFCCSIEQPLDYEQFTLEPISSP